jgi:hypothetical protein
LKYIGVAIGLPVFAIGLYLFTTLHDAPGWQFALYLLITIGGGITAFCDWASSRMVKEIVEYNMRPCTKCGAKRYEGQTFYGFDHWCPKCQIEFSDLFCGSWLSEERISERKCHVCKQWFSEWEVERCGNFQVCLDCKEISKTDILEVEGYIVKAGKVFQKSCM